MPLRSSRRNYNRVSSSPASSEAIDQSNLDEPLSPSSSFAAVDNIPAEGDETEALAINQTAKPTPSIHNEISVVLLDGAQTKFIVKCDPMWKVSEFKSVSASVSISAKTAALPWIIIHVFENVIIPIFQLFYLALTKT